MHSLHHAPVGLDHLLAGGSRLEAENGVRGALVHGAVPPGAGLPAPLLPAVTEALIEVVEQQLGGVFFLPVAVVQQLLQLRQFQAVEIAAGEGAGDDFAVEAVAVLVQGHLQDAGVDLRGSAAAGGGRLSMPLAQLLE